MTISREIKIGFLVVVSALVLIAGFYFLKGSNIFKKEKRYFAFFNSANGIAPSSAVLIKGLQVGKVDEIKLDNSSGKLGGVKLTLTVSSDIDLPRGTIAKLKSADLLGSKIISLELGVGPGTVENNETLPSDIEGGLIDNISTEISPLLKRLDHLVATFDSAAVSVLNAENRKNLQEAIASFNVTMTNFKGVSQGLNNRTAEMEQLITNANSVASNLKNNNSKITNVLSNVENLTDQLSRAPIDATFANLNKASSELKALLEEINSNQGTLGLLIKDPKLYTELNSTLNSLTRLTTDLRRHPSRYINISVFGKKDKEGTITPETNVSP